MHLSKTNFVRAVILGPLHPLTRNLFRSLMGISDLLSVSLTENKTKEKRGGHDMAELQGFILNYFLIS